jgi:hypothetical protein
MSKPDELVTRLHQRARLRRIGKEMPTAWDWTIIAGLMGVALVIALAMIPLAILHRTLVVLGLVSGGGDRG